MLRNVRGERLSGGRADVGAQLAKPLHRAFDLRVIRPGGIKADEVLDNSMAKPLA